MVRTLAVSFLLLCGLAGLARSSQKPSTIRSIDFKNFSFAWDDDMQSPSSNDDPTPWHWLQSLPKSRIAVKNGIYHFYSPGDSQFDRERAPLVSVDDVHYGDLDGSGTDEAAVHLNYSSGGTQNWDYLYIYRTLGVHPQLIAVLESGERAYGGLYRTAIQNHALVLDFADPERRVGDCCSEGYIRVHYRWKSDRFVEEGPREHGDIDLKPH